MQVSQRVSSGRSVGTLGQRVRVVSLIPSSSIVSQLVVLTSDERAMDPSGERREASLVVIMLLLGARFLHVSTSSPHLKAVRQVFLRHPPAPASMVHSNQEHQK
jgi:hypothetical protein